ncbi:hypothetical protein NHX12_001643 [Muraenolepis orangiensis]|nr:hypothetical protein NHX12_001643 [Muraenolepis orangiensis]
MKRGRDGSVLQLSEVHHCLAPPEARLEELEEQIIDFMRWKCFVLLGVAANMPLFSRSEFVHSLTLKDKSTDLVVGRGHRTRGC